MGPLDIVNYNSKYILTLQCNLTKYVEAYLLKKADTLSVDSSLVNNFMLRNGIVKEINTNQDID